MHGAESWLRDNFDITSVISSSVPVPPGNAIKASPSSIIFVFLSVISLVTISSVISSYWTSASTKNCGSTPVTLPPSISTLSASSPISPVLEPPYIKVCPFAPIHFPSSLTAIENVSSMPLLAPKYTVMFTLLSTYSLLIQVICLALICNYLH